MKNTFALLLALVLCLTLPACGSEPQTPAIDETIVDETEPEPTGDALVLHDEEEGYTFINQDRFREIVETVELTAENWADCLTVCSYTEERVTRDTFGEITATETVTHHVLGAADERFYYLSDFAIELTDKSTGEATVYESSLEVAEDFDLSLYDCTRIKGTLYLIDVPEEAMMRSEDGIRYFTVRYSDISYGPPCTCDLAGVDGRAVSGLFSHIIYFW